MNQYYGDGHKTLTHVSMNSAHWRIFNPAHPKGNLLSPTRAVPTWLWVMMATLVIWGLVMGGKYIARCRKYLKKNKEMGLVEEKE